MHGSRVGGQRLRQGRHVVPLVSLQVVGLHAGEVAALIPPPDHVQVLIQAAGEETSPPEESERTTFRQRRQESGKDAFEWKLNCKNEPLRVFKCVWGWRERCQTHLSCIGGSWIQLLNLGS